MDFPLLDRRDEHARYDRLVALSHPGGRARPRRGAAEGLGVHRRHRDPVLDHQGGHRGRGRDAFTGTPPRGIRRPPARRVLIRRGVAQAAPTARRARELGCDREHPLRLRHRLPGNARRRLGRNPPGDAVVEADEMDRDAGEKRPPARRPGRPAPSAGRPPPGPRHVRRRSAAHRRSRRAGRG